MKLHIIDREDPSPSNVSIQLRIFSFRYKGKYDILDVSLEV